MLLIKKILFGIVGCALFAGSWYGSYKLMWIINPGYTPMNPDPKASQKETKTPTAKS